MNVGNPVDNPSVLQKSNTHKFILELLSYLIYVSQI